MVGVIVGPTLAVRHGGREIFFFSWAPLCYAYTHEQENMSSERGEFGSRLGFVLAAAGSTIGLGNIWRFPYVAGEAGGGAFLVLYLAMVFTLGLSIMLAEIAIGRAAKRNPVGAFRTLKGGAWTGLGYLGVLAAFVILSFYSVIGGWTLAYVLATLGPLLEATDARAFGDHFRDFTAGPVEPVLYHGLFMLLSAGVVMGGVRAGIERWSKLLMPLLFIMLVALCLRALTLPGAWAGVEFFLIPDWQRFDAATIGAAMSQAFFSMSLGMGCLLTYGSYLSSAERLPGIAVTVSALDTTIAMLAGLLILPATFAFGFDPASGPGLSFVTLPAVFAEMPLGRVFAPLFFALLAIAALTSNVSLLETAVAYLVDEKGTGRRAATAIAAGLGFAIGVPSALAFGPFADATLFGKTFFGLMEYLATNLLMPIGGIGIAVFAGWIIRDRIRREVLGDGWNPQLLGAWGWILRWLAPAAVAWILISGL
jgi:NSS family neurotransmitter:Na+ symporter